MKLKNIWNHEQIVTGIMSYNLQQTETPVTTELAEQIYSSIENWVHRLLGRTIMPGVVSTDVVECITHNLNDLVFCNQMRNQLDNYSDDGKNHQTISTQPFMGGNKATQAETINWNNQASAMNAIRINDMNDKALKGIYNELEELLTVFPGVGGDE